MLLALLPILILAAFAVLIGPGRRSAADERRSDLAAMGRTGHLDL